MAAKREALWLWAVTVFGTGKRLWQAAENIEDMAEFTDAVKKHGLSYITQAEYDRADALSFEQAEEMLENCEKSGQKYLCYESEGYPKRLRKIADPPAMLFYKGNLDFLNDKCVINVVGTRNPSEYSLNTADKLCRELCEKGFILGSGFANGIDQRVNCISLENNSFPLAVCASPIDYDYPKGSSELKEMIAEKGVVISEMPSGSRMFSGSFTARNRISVGLSDGVLFVEAGSESRGLDNFSHAVYQGKTVFAVPPHDIYDKRYFGQRDLIRNGCVPVFDAQDIVRTLSEGNVYGLKYASENGGYAMPTEDSGFFGAENNIVKAHKDHKQSRKAEKPAGYPDETISETKNNKKNDIDYSALEEQQADICRLLEEKAMLADEIAAVLEKDISEVFAELTELELNGYVASLPGKMYGLIR